MKRNNRYDADKPQYTWGNKWMQDAASEQQIGFIRVLVEQAGITVTGDLGTLSKGQASSILSSLNGMNMDYVREHREYLPISALNRISSVQFSR